MFWSLDPEGNHSSEGACPKSEKNPPRSPDTGGGSRRPTSRRRRQEPGGDGEVEGRALNRLEELHGERILFKGTIM